MKFNVAVLVVLLLVLAGSSAYGSQVLFYSGPDQLTYGNFGLPSIADGYAVTDNFTIASNSTVGTIGFSAWILSGNTPTTIFWAITTTPGLTSVLGSGTASLNNALTASNVQGGNDVFWSQFNVNVPLASGSYWLWLSMGTPSLTAVGWGYTNNSGVSEDFFDNGTYRLTLGGTQSFELLSPSTSTPEPAGLVLFGSGVLGLSGLVRRRLNL